MPKEPQRGKMETSPKRNRGHSLVEPTGARWSPLSLSQAKRRSGEAEAMELGKTRASVDVCNGEWGTTTFGLAPKSAGKMLEPRGG